MGRPDALQPTWTLSPSESLPSQAWDTERATPQSRGCRLLSWALLSRPCYPAGNMLYRTTVVLCILHSTVRPFWTIRAPAGCSSLGVESKESLKGPLRLEKLDG